MDYGKVINPKRIDVEKLLKELDTYNPPHTKQSGNFGEILASDHKMNNQLVKDAGYDLELIGKRPPSTLNDKLSQGIDAVYRNNNPESPYKFVIDEGKYNTARQGMTIDGLQMSDPWLTGAETGKSRILKAVGNDKVLADEITDALVAGDVARVLTKVDVDGNVTSHLLNSDGKIISRWP